MDFVSTCRRDVGAVAIGGITLDNVQRVIYQSQAASRALQGVAVVSSIIGAEQPKEAASEFAKKIASIPAFATQPPRPRPAEVSTLLNAAPEVVCKVATQNPLCHSMINSVVMNFAANTLLSM